MIFRKAAIMAAVLAVVCSSSAHAGYYHVLAPVVSKSAGASGGSSGGGSGGNWHLCPTPAGIFICAVAVGIIVHEVFGPACASKSKYNVAHGYDQPTLWRPLCNWKRDPAARVRTAAPAKLWPMGK